MYSLICSCINSKQSPSQQSTDQKAVVKRLLQTAGGKCQPGKALTKQMKDALHLTETGNALSLLQHMFAARDALAHNNLFFAQVLITAIPAGVPSPPITLPHFALHFVSRDLRWTVPCISPCIMPLSPCTMSLCCWALCRFAAGL